MAATKKVQCATLYTQGIDGHVIVVRPADKKKFTHDEISMAVQGSYQTMIPRDRYALVYVNEEGAMLPFLSNKFTWIAAKYDVYRLNGYAFGWRVRGNILVVRSVLPDEALESGVLPTIAETLTRKIYKAEVAGRG